MKSIGSWSWSSMRIDLGLRSWYIFVLGLILSDPVPFFWTLEFRLWTWIWDQPPKYGWMVYRANENFNLSTFNSLSSTPASSKTALFSIFGKQMKPTWQTSFISTSGERVLRIQDFPFSNWFWASFNSSLNKTLIYMNFCLQKSVYLNFSLKAWDFGSKALHSICRTVDEA